MESGAYGPYDDGMKHCRYCGSLDPRELAEAIKQGKATMHGSDWKYGYPHKFYVDIPNLIAGKIVRMGGRYTTNEQGEPLDEPIMRPAPAMCMSKFYTEHLALLDEATFNEVAPIINAACGITFFKENGQLKYRTSPFNYQKD
jgi:hypothetical protein